jgi:putative spermidine/putrescine transport system permease protein
MGRFVKLSLAGVLLLVALPMVVVVIASFSAGETLSFPPAGYSLAPYAQLLDNEVIRVALGRSLYVGALVVALAITTGVPASIALVRYKPRFRLGFTAYLLLGITTPLIASAFAFLVIYTRVGLIGELWPIAVAITVANLPFLMFSVSSALATLDPYLEEAAATLGAEKVQTFLFVTLPGMAPGILSGTIMIFVLGISEFLISLILSTVATQTLPVAIFGSLRGPVPPTLAAAAGLYILIAFIVVGVLTSLRTTEQFFYRSD